jgi:hypothetical protein
MVVIAMPQLVNNKQQRPQRRRRPQRIYVSNIKDDSISPQLIRQLFSRYGRVGKVVITSHFVADGVNVYLPCIYLELHDGTLEEGATVTWNGNELGLEWESQVR